ncbi:helix-turn-helix domain-containing protein [Herbidospora mongoliensis]|uniref:helix-turn-helix domain-containing protein n=1 Tax=Herbidospora mongoliensis TaxID=688067 RepID=UPI000829914D|nr:ClpX C4-type zinc finger protein [Herbidospora mongoliensis]
MTTDVRIRCSFCGKPENEVERIVAGPGVYICDQCVSLAATVIEQSAATGEDSPDKPKLPIWNSLSDEEMLSHIPRVAAHIDATETDLTAWVRELRRRGVTWAKLGEALGITRQSAWERFSGEE